MTYSKIHNYMCSDLSQFIGNVARLFITIEVKTRETRQHNEQAITAARSNMYYCCQWYLNEAILTMAGCITATP